MIELPYLTSDLPGIGGRIKEAVEDFRVEEIPLYQPSGEGFFGFPNASIGSPTVGQITSTNNDSRDLQLALKFEW